MNFITVGKENAGERLDVFLARAHDAFSRARWQSLIRSQCVTLNGKPTRTREIVRTGDEISWMEPAAEKIAAEPENIPLSILFEDDDLLVLNKPAGMVVHPGAGNSQHTLVNALLGRGGVLSEIGGKERPGIVHRLDKETSGCLVIAKNDLTHQDLSRQFAARSVEKIYLALVVGTLRKPAGTIETQIGRHPVHRQRMAVTQNGGRTARTTYRSLGSNNGISLVECALHSGRTHQIRVHLQHLGHPVLGDKMYAGKRANNFPRQLLHAWKLAFEHPRRRERMKFTAPLPDDFAAALQQYSLAGIR